jgi:hypothetical protein
LYDDVSTDVVALQNAIRDAKREFESDHESHSLYQEFVKRLREESFPILVQEAQTELTTMNLKR